MLRTVLKLMIPRNTGHAALICYRMIIICFKAEQILTAKNYDYKVQTIVTRWPVTKDANFFQSGIERLILRYDRCLKYGGDYVTKLWYGSLVKSDYFLFTNSHNLFYDRSLAYSKVSFPHSAISFFLIQFPVSCRFLKGIQQLLTYYPPLIVTFILPPVFLSITCFKRQFLRKTWQIQLTFLFVTVVGHFFPPWLYVILSFSHDWSTWSSPSFSKTIFQKVPVISELCPET